MPKKEALIVWGGWKQFYDKILPAIFVRFWWDWSATKPMYEEILYSNRMRPYSQHFIIGGRLALWGGDWIGVKSLWNRNKKQQKSRVVFTSGLQIAIEIAVWIAAKFETKLACVNGLFTKEYLYSQWRANWWQFNRTWDRVFYVKGFQAGKKIVFFSRVVTFCQKIKLAPWPWS